MWQDKTLHPKRNTQKPHHVFLLTVLAMWGTLLLGHMLVWRGEVNCNSCSKGSTRNSNFQETLAGPFQDAWDEFNQVESPVQWSEPLPSKAKLMEALFSVASLPPLHPVNETCRPPPLDPYPICSGGTGLTGSLLEHPRRIVHMVMLGFEVDTLEIMLREELDVVDVIFLVEATRSHNTRGEEPRATKPLVWDRLKYTPRFDFVPKKKVIHVVVDDVEMLSALTASKQDNFAVEDLQTLAGIERIKYWDATVGGLSGTDVFISGDVDEVPSRETLYRLRWCELAGPVTSSALWMPMGSLDRAYLDDRMAPDLPYTFSSPTIYLWSGILSGQHDGTRLTHNATLKERRIKYVTGGIHMTNHAMLAHVMLKELSATSYAANAPTCAYTLALLNKEQQDRYALKMQPELLDLVVPLEALDKQYDGWLRFVPWFLNCNRRRFPYWFGQPDPRNQALLYALKQVASGRDSSILAHLYHFNKLM